MINVLTLARVMPKVIQMLVAAACSEGAKLPPNKPASAGSNTSTSTMIKSSTISQPTAICPLIDSSTPRDSSALSNTTVLATESESPKTSAPPIFQSQYS